MQRRLFPLAFFLVGALGLAETRGLAAPPTHPSATTPSTASPSTAMPEPGATNAVPPARSQPTTPPTTSTPTAQPATKTPEPTTETPKPDPRTKPEANTTQRKTAITARLTLKVQSPHTTRSELNAKVTALGGFPFVITDDQLILKLPPGELSRFLDELAKAGQVIEKSLQRQDLTLEIAKLEGQLQSKRAILAELRGFFDSSDVEATLNIERSMNQLVAELEQVKGALRVAEDRARWAVLEVNFRFKERQRITRLTSPFEWLNSVDLDRFLEEF